MPCGTSWPVFEPTNFLLAKKVNVRICISCQVQVCGSIFYLHCCCSCICDPAIAGFQALLVDGKRWRCQKFQIVKSLLLMIYLISTSSHFGKWFLVSKWLLRLSSSLFFMLSSLLLNILACLSRLLLIEDGIHSNERRSKHWLLLVLEEQNHGVGLRVSVVLGS